MVANYLENLVQKFMIISSYWSVLGKGKPAICTTVAEMGTKWEEPWSHLKYDPWTLDRE